MADQTYPYNLIFSEDGVYLDVLPRYIDAADILMPSLVMFDLNRRRIQGMNHGDIIIKLRQKKFPLRIAEPQEEQDANSCAFVNIIKEGMQAILYLLPPAGNGETESADTILEQIKNTFTVTYGLNEETVSLCVALKDYYKPQAIAVGKEPVNGKDGKLEILIAKEHSKMPKLRPDGSVDYKNLDLFTSVTAGDTLVIRLQPTPGIPGCTVQGKEIPAKDGKDAVMPRSKNTYFSEDGNIMYASKDGRADFIGGQIVVTDTYIINGNADMTVGNIDFLGDVVIHGHVIAGLIIKAGGNIEVKDTVECATLIAKNDVILQKGIQGNDTALIKAGGNVVSRFIERCIVEAGNNVFSDYIVYSDITAEGDVLLKGKHGKLIGGITRAGGNISVHTAGTPTGEKTILELGNPTPLRTALNVEMEKLQSIRDQLAKLDSLIKLYSSKQNSADNVEMWQKILESRNQLSDAHNESLQEAEVIKEKLEGLNKSKVNIYGEAYPDVKISIGNYVYATRENMKYVTFKVRDGEIVFTACEYNERGE